LIQLQSNNAGFLSKGGNGKAPKMQCGCRFIKQNIVDKPTGKATSFIEVNSRGGEKIPQNSNLQNVQNVRNKIGKHF
jgi:hypothetical protein